MQIPFHSSLVLTVMAGVRTPFGCLVYRYLHETLFLKMDAHDLYSPSSPLQQHRAVFVARGVHPSTSFSSPKFCA